MKKITIKSELISDEKTKFLGRGILKDNEIIFYENGVKTKIKLNVNNIIIERVKDYKLIMKFIKGKNTKATYTIYDHNLLLDIYTEELKINENNFKIEYILMISDSQKMNFIYNVEYSIDSE